MSLDCKVNIMSEFRITKELLSGYCQSGYTVKDMSQAIEKESGYKCPVETVRQACKAYGIDLRRKPLRSPFVYGDLVPLPSQSGEVATKNEEEEGALNTQAGISI